MCIYDANSLSFFFACLFSRHRQPTSFFFFPFVFIHIEDNVFKSVNISYWIEVVSKKTLAVESMGDVSG